MQALRALYRTATRLAVGGALIGGGTFAAAMSTTDDPSTALQIATAVPVRIVRCSLTAAVVAFDYKYSLWGVPETSEERAVIMHEVHTRCASRIRDLCFKNGGIYIKLGQHISQLEYVVPEEYVEIMRASMLNKCPTSSFDDVCKVFQKELGKLPNEIFEEFDSAPFASASLAQVHTARTRDGKKVAVKVQHAHVTDTAIADTASVELIVNALHWCFPSFDYRWLVDEIHESLPKEMDFICEAKNSQRCMLNFVTLSPYLARYIYVPQIYWDLSNTKVLSMEFIEGAEITDVAAIRKLGIHPKDVAKLVNQAFAEMIFKHGFVHCDPHAANLFVRPLPSEKRSILGGRKPQLVLIDHGLYKELDYSTRTNYAALWKALVFSDAKAIKENSVKLGAGEDLYALFAGILTMRPWQRVIDRAADHLVIHGSAEERSELQMYASQYFPQIAELLSRLPRVILLMFKTNDCLRAVTNKLMQGSSDLETFLIIGRVSSEAVSEAKSLQSRSYAASLVKWIEELFVEARLLSMQIGLWLLQVRRAVSG